MRSSRPPVVTLAVAPIACLLAVLLVGLGVVGIRDALVGSGAVGGSMWTASFAGALDGLTPATWMVPVGALAVVVGLWWLGAALTPRRRSEVQLTGSGAVWVRPGDVGRWATQAAEDVDGVTRATSTATRRAVTVTVQTTATDDADLRRRVGDVVGERLAALDPTPRVRVRDRMLGGRR